MPSDDMVRAEQRKAEQSSGAGKRGEHSTAVEQQSKEEGRAQHSTAAAVRAQQRRRE